MTRRVFVSTAHAGLAAASSEVVNGRATFKPTATFAQMLLPEDGGPKKHPLRGHGFAVSGPGDVVGFDTGVVLRCEPPPGTTDAVENNLVNVDLADARLPWLLNLPGMGDRPWIGLVVLREDEARLKPGQPLPTVAAPAHALPHPDELAAWTHVEVRLEDGEEVPALLAAEARTGTDRVVARLVCPRRLEPEKGWLACIVPTTLAGMAAGRGDRPTAEQAGRPAWRPGSGAELPVYYSWTFRTGQAGSFEDLARLVQPVDASDIPGMGERTIDVSKPWPHQPPEGGAAPARAPIQGALRVPGAVAPEETWTDQGARDEFRDRLATLLNAPGQLAAADRDEGALAPPLYGSHHTGHRAVPGAGWMNTLNIEVRHRIAASLGARYVQLEQEFLMERAWEQAGEIREANRRLAAAELAAEASTVAQAKHLAPMADDELTVLGDPVHDQVSVPTPAGTIASALAASAVPDGTTSTRFRRLARRGGALSRRTARARRTAGMDMAPSTPVVAEGLGGVAVVPLQPVAWFAAGADESATTVAVDGAATSGTRTLVDLLGGQASLFSDRQEFVGDTLTGVLDQMQGGMGGAMVATAVTVEPPAMLRRLRREVVAQGLASLPTVAVSVDAPLTMVAEGIRNGLDAVPQQLTLLAEHIVTPDMAGRVPAQTRPLRRIMDHPRFGFPVAAELLSRWPDWTIPGITTFPENSVTLLETNPPFVEACLVGLNQEFNRELLWREYPTDQAGTPFARFWPGNVAEFGEIALWGDGDALGSHDPAGGAAQLTLLVRADVLRRYPGTALWAVQADAQRRVPETGGNWLAPAFTLPIDDRTSIFGFSLTAAQALAGSAPWLFVLREPMRGTQFGFDLRTTTSPALLTWADLTWDEVPKDRERFASARGTPTALPSQVTDADPKWGINSADLAAITFQRPFQVAFSPTRLLGMPLQ